ncbi:MAG: hypothetical protein PHY40_03805 [Patescibacteria group bacterium]|nr:hypothetical protein [Patescibacteria group bacterium]
MYKRIRKHYEQKYKGVYRHAKKLFIFDLFLLTGTILMLAAASFFFFWKPDNTDFIDLSISLGDKKIKSGDKICAEIKYANRNKISLESTTLSVQLPAGFIVDRDLTPESVYSQNSTVNLKELEPGSAGKIEICGQLWTIVGQENKITALLTYKPEDAETREQKFANFLFISQDSILDGKLSAPSSALTGVVSPFSFEITNTGAETIKDITVVLDWTGKIESENALENFYLAPSETKKISGQITMPAKPGNYVLTIYPRVTINNLTFVQKTNIINMIILPNQIKSEARIKTQNKNYAESGDILPVEISWVNENGLKIKNLQARVFASPAGIVDWTASAKNNGLKTDGSSLIIDSQARTAFSGSTEDKFTIDLKLLPEFDTGQKEKIYLEIKPIMEGVFGEEENQKFTGDGVSDKIALATELVMSASTRYYTSEGDQLGRGPLPPRVNETTKYWIFVKITNSSNAVKQVKFNTVLPTGVEFTGKQSITIGPQIKYNPTVRSMSWEYSELPANSQTGLYFEVSITPNSEQIGKTIQLTENLQFSAEDGFTGKKFILKQNGLFNSLSSDDRGSSYGASVLP